MAKAIQHPASQAYDHLARLTTVARRHEVAGPTRYWVATSSSLDWEEEDGKWVFESGLISLARAFGCRIIYE